MQRKLLLSIITINLNNLEGLKKTMQSVFKQTWQEFEYIVIDGGSTDGSKAYIESNANQINYWISEKDSGIYNAMNKGIRAAKGEYLLFLNSGDFFISEEVLLQSLNILNSYELIYFNINVVDGTKTFSKSYPKELYFSYFVHESLPHPATFIKSTLLEKIGFYDESLKIVADWKFFILSVCKFNASYLQVNETLTSFSLDGISSHLQSREIISYEKKKVLDSDFPLYMKDFNRLVQLESLISNLRNSKKLQALIKLGLLKRF